MSPTRADPLDVIYEDDETDEGAISADGGTSLHGNPDHEHADEDVRVLTAENVLLRENVTALVREVARADAEMARWRSRCRKIEDERDALSRELDRCKAELERRHTRPQSMVVYSTAESGPRPEQQSPPMYRPTSSPDAGPSPPLRFSSPRMHALPPGAAQPYARQSLPAIAVSPTREPTPPGPGVPTHRGRLAPPRAIRSPSPQERGRERNHELNRRGYMERMQLQELERSQWEQSRLELEAAQRFEKAQRDAEQSQREYEQAQQEWEHVQFLQDQERNATPVVYSTGMPDGWSYFDIPVQNDGWNVAQSPSFVPTSQSASSLPSPIQTPSVYSSAYPHPNGHGQGRHVREEGPPRRNAARQDTRTLPLSNTQTNTPSPLRTQVQLQPQKQPYSQPHPVAQEQPEVRQTPADDVPVPALAAASTQAPSSGSTSSAGSHDAAQGDAAPRTPPDPVPAPAKFTFSPTSAAFSPTGLRGISPHVLSPASPVFQPHTPVVDPEFGPVIVHGPLPPRHTQVPNGQAPAPAPQRRKREPASVPPRHLASGKGAVGVPMFGGAAFAGAAMGMGGGVALALGARGTEGDGGWAWGRR